MGSSNIAGLVQYNGRDLHGINYEPHRAWDERFAKPARMAFGALQLYSH
jgi:hypothetical protein